MSHRIITIEREYASGGREIGEMIAERLGIPCYNREILQMASMDYLETAEEAAPKSFLYTLMLTSSPTRTIEENLPLSDKVYIIETNIIRELAEKGDCVIVGRCASYILRDLENLFNVFIYADTKSRSERAVQEYHVDERRVEAMLRKIDKRRETFYSINTGGNWYSSASGCERCICRLYSDCGYDQTGRCTGSAGIPAGWGFHGGNADRRQRIGGGSSRGHFAAGRGTRQVSAGG